MTREEQIAALTEENDTLRLRIGQQSEQITLAHQEYRELEVEHLKVQSELACAKERIEQLEEAKSPLDEHDGERYFKRELFMRLYATAPTTDPGAAWVIVRECWRVKPEDC